MKTEKEKMLSGEGYFASDEQLNNERKNARRLTRLINVTTEEEENKRVELVRELFGSAGKNIFVETPFRCDYGYNIHVGDNFFANFNCVFLDVGEIRIGNNCFMAPNVQLFTAYHPLDAKTRNTTLEYGAPITIGDSVWIGGGVIINPGITIGDNVVIGSGSVVTKDIPSNSIAVGNPCKVIKKIEE